MRLAALTSGALLGAFTLAASVRAAPPSPSVAAFLVENGRTGVVLAQKDGDHQLPVASLTKLMTVLVALPRLRPEQRVTVPESVTTVGESSAGLEAGQSLTVRELLEAALVPSANDAVDTLAYAASDGRAFDRFPALMNAKARKLGLRHTRFDRPDGLSDGDQSSARDITRIARIDMRRPLVRSIVRMRSVDIGGITLDARNNLLSTYPGALGVKTGHTDAAGWSEVAAARRNGVTIYATVLGAPTEATRDAALADLLDWGFSRYRPAVVVSSHRVYAKARTGFGRAPVPLVASRSAVRPVRVGRPVVERVLAPDAVSLPVEKGQRLGEVRITQAGHVVARRPLVAARSVSRPGLAGRVGWYLGRTFHNIWNWL